MADILLLTGACLVAVAALAGYVAALLEMLLSLRVALRAKDWKAAGLDLLFSLLVLGLGLILLAVLARYQGG